MRNKRFGAGVLLGAMVLAQIGVAVAGESEAMAGQRPVRARCSRAVVAGEVRAGEEFRKVFGLGLEVLLEPLASGWVVRVLPKAGERPREDFAEIATPPYRSVSPLLVSTDFSFRAQDAVGWNPRRFRYAANPRVFGTLQTIYRRVTGTRSAAAADEASLASLAAAQPGGLLEILDAGLAPGTANQSQAAALVASHFETTAHRIEPPMGGRASALGRIEWMRFRLKLELERGAKPAPGVAVESYPCERE